MKRLLIFAVLLATRRRRGAHRQPPVRPGRRPRSRRTSAASSRSIGKQVPGAGIPLIYHGGPVMTTNKTYAIYWVPSGYSIAAGLRHDDQPVLHGRRARQRHGRRTSTPSRHAVLDGIQYNSTFGGSFTDTNRVPGQRLPALRRAARVPDRRAAPDRDQQRDREPGLGQERHEHVLHVHGAERRQLLRLERQHVRVHGLLRLPRHRPARARSTPTSRTRGSRRGCDEGQYPNGSSNHADPTINVTSHEHNEAITDPQLNAWYDAAGQRERRQVRLELRRGLRARTAPSTTRRSTGTTTSCSRSGRTPTRTSTCVQTYSHRQRWRRRRSDRSRSFFPDERRVGTRSPSRARTSPARPGSRCTA